MTFVFTVEDGTQVTGSNSYIDVSDASDYLAANIHIGATWTGLTQLQQQQLLVWASRYIDSRATWYGVPTSQWLASPDDTNVVGGWAFPSSGSQIVQQSMRWPRVGVKDVDGFVIEGNVIPQALKNAVAEMARYLIASDRTLERPQDGLNELKVDVITFRFKDYTLPIVPSEVSYILRGLGTISNGRTNFSKITRA